MLEPSLCARAYSVLIDLERRSTSLFKHDLYRKPVPTFRDHVIERAKQIRPQIL